MAGVNPVDRSLAYRLFQVAFSVMFQGILEWVCFRDCGIFLRSAEFYVVEKVSCFTEVGILDDGTVRVEFEGNYYEFI